MALDYQDIHVEIVEETIFAEIKEELISVNLVEETISVEITEEVISVGISEETIDVTIGTEDIIVEVEHWSCPQIIEAGGSGGGFIFITDVTTTGIVGNKIYEANTVPAEAVLNEATIDNANCTIHFIAEGGEAYSPVVSIDGTICTNLTEISQDKRLFSGSIAISVDSSQEIEVESSTGQSDTIQINRAEAPPSILTALIGAYPGSQTAAKSGDSINVTGTVDGTATHVRIKSSGAFIDSGWISCSGGTFTITGTISSLSGLQDATLYAKNELGSEGPDFISFNDILLDQVAPSFTDLGTTFPAGQGAFKNLESGSQQTQVHNYSSVVYSSPHGDFDIENLTTYEENKNIQCTNPGDYNDSSTNFRIVAYKAANDTSNTFNKTIEVADIAPVITVTQPYTRLRSSPSGALYTITATSNQNLADEFLLNVPVSGTWQGTEFSGGPKTFYRGMRIFDSDVVGSGVWDFSGAIPTNNAGLSATITGTQVVGGFVSRSISLPAFESEVDLTTYVSVTSKLSLTWTVKDNMVFQPIGSSPPIVGGWTIDATGHNPTRIIILDTQAAGSSSQESTITIQESV